MLRRPTSPRADVQRLLEEGYEVELRQGFLLVHAVPYVTPTREVALGTLISAYDEAGKPADHTVWFQGETPSIATGEPLGHLVIEATPQILFDTFEITHRFSNKKSETPGFPEDYYEKMVHYSGLLRAHARAIDPNADPRTGRVVPSKDESSPFIYPDSASARAGIVAIAQKLEMSRVAIVGVGGTGGYILDHLAKTRVREIHIFDGAHFKRHNAFRAPGAASIEQLERRPLKVEYFGSVYGAMHKAVVPHPYYIDSGTIEQLRLFDFVFISVDDGPSRAQISQMLVAWNIPFIDVGLGLEKSPDDASLLGIARVTLASKTKSDHLSKRLPTAVDNDEALYRSNIQVSDMNALNACLAVIRWKQFFGFYADYDRAHHITYSVAQQSIARGEVPSSE